MGKFLDAINDNNHINVVRILLSPIKLFLTYWLVIYGQSEEWNMRHHVCMDNRAQQQLYLTTLRSNGQVI